MLRSTLLYLAAFAALHAPSTCGGGDVEGEPGGATSGASSGSSSSSSGVTSPAPSTDGTPPPGLVTLASGQTCPWGLAIDSTSVYWTTCGDPGTGAVTKVPIGGGPTTTLATGNRLSGIAVDATSVYWIAGTADCSSGALMKVPFGGGTPTTLTALPCSPAHVAVDSTSLYWIELPDAVMKVALTGGQPTSVASSPGGGFQLALDATNVYWVAEGVMKAPKSGGPAIQLSPNSPILPTSGIAVNATNVFWTTQVPSGVSTVPIDGGSEALVYAQSPTSMPGVLAIDDAKVYWSAGGDILSVPLAGGSAATLATGQNDVVAIAVDATSVYWLDNGNGTPGSVMKLTPK